MKYLKITITLLFIFHFNNILLGQENYISLNDSQKVALQVKVDTLLKAYISFKNFSSNGEANMVAIDKYKKLFDSEKSKVFDDLHLRYTDNMITIQSYITDISLDFGDVDDDLFTFQYPRKIGFDSVRYYQKEKYFYVPVKLQKSVKYKLNESGEVVKSNDLLNLKVYVNIYEDSNNAKIIGILEDLTTSAIWLDCEGIENGSAIIGSACDDENELTENDIYQFDCSCSGSCISKVGDSCDDGNDLTINDIYQSDCTCAGTCEVPVGEACDDGNDLTINDIYQNDCTCLGMCEVPVGKACDDGNDLTIKDVYQADCTCTGICEFTVGDKCDDNNNLTNNDIYQDDCTCAGTCTVTVGEPCDDGDDLTINDVYQSDCSCLGICEAPVGEPCDDGDDLTINDVYQSDCSCLGICEAPVGEPCDDGDDLTINDVYQSDCSCLGICKVPVGEPCDDEDDLTINDVYQSDCSCLGSCEVPVGEPCDDENSLTVDDVYQDDCTCVGTCIVTLGDTCDDGNDLTINDMYQADCTCAGICNITVGVLCNDDNDLTINDKYREDCTCKGDSIPITPSSFGISVGPVIQIPFLNSYNNENFSKNLNYGAKLVLNVTPPKSEKVNFQAGIAFLQINQNYSLNDYKDKVYLENVQILDENIDSLELMLNGISETFNLNVLQISLGISYSLISNSKNNILIDIFVKPNIILPEPEYALEASQEKNLFTNSFGTSLALADLADNSIIEAAKAKGYINSNKLELPSSNIEMNSFPIAIGTGLSYAHKLAKKSSINAYIHYNYFVIPISWVEPNEQEKIEDSKIINVLINTNKLPMDRNFTPLSNYFDIKNNTNIELGLTYQFKF